MDLKFSFIIPCYNGSWQETSRCINSILDQDYRNYEIIFVSNGKWKGKRDLIKKIREEYGTIKVLSLDHANVCNARNRGAEAATGDILSFLSSDLALHPGTLRTWQIELSKHPDYGFLYSGYRFFDDPNLNIYLSESFDPYKLECYNYIDGANPVRREVNQPFDPEVISLNDWDWILSVVRKGVKGYYISEPLYSAEPPKAGGLSLDSASNWLRRTEQIKQKHGIPLREICVTSLLDESEALRIAKEINADYNPFPGRKPNKYKVVYVYGFACDDRSLEMQVASITNQVITAHKIIHWIGVDIKTLTSRPWMEVQALVKGIFTHMKEHWVISPSDQSIIDDALRLASVKSKVVFPPFPQPRDGKLQDLVYISDRELLQQVRFAMPDISLTNTQGNGIPKVSIHFQDKPSNILKAAAEGSEVISEFYFPYLRYLHCDNLPNIRKQIVHTIRQLNRDGATKNADTIAYYRKPTFFINKIKKYLEMPNKLARLEDIMESMPSQDMLKQ